MRWSLAAASGISKARKVADQTKALLTAEQLADAQNEALRIFAEIDARKAKR